MDNLCDLFNSKLQISENLFKTGFKDLEKLYSRQFKYNLNCGKCHSNLATVIAVTMEADIYNKYRHSHDIMLCDYCCNHSTGEVFSGNKLIVDGCGITYRAAVIFAN